MIGWLLVQVRPTASGFRENFQVPVGRLRMREAECERGNIYIFHKGLKLKARTRLLINKFATS